MKKNNSNKVCVDNVKNSHLENNEPSTPKRRKGRLKKGEVIKMSGKKTMTIDEAFKSVEGMKHKIANKYKPFCTTSVSYEDLIGAANIGLAWAYRDWDADQAKFTTFSHQRIERQIDLYLAEMLPRYKNNIDAKNWLRRKNDESFKQLQERKITKDPEFNEEHGLDGTKEFTRQHYNLYTQKVANKLYNNGNHLIISNASTYKSDEHEDFDIFDSIADERFDPSKEEPSHEFTGIKKEIIEMILEGYTINETAKKFNMSKQKLLKLLGQNEREIYGK